MLISKQAGLMIVDRKQQNTIENIFIMHTSLHAGDTVPCHPAGV